MEKITPYGVRYCPHNYESRLALLDSLKWAVKNGLAVEFSTVTRKFVDKFTQVCTTNKPFTLRRFWIPEGTSLVYYYIDRFNVRTLAVDDIVSATIFYEDEKGE